MLNRKTIFLSLLFASLFMWCAQECTAGIDQGGDHDINELHIESVLEPAGENKEGTVSVAEPNGVLNLGQVLALTLMNNPE